MAIERAETRFIREIARSKKLWAEARLEIIHLQATAANVKPDAGLIGEWNGQIIAYTQILTVLEGM